MGPNVWSKVYWEDRHMGKSVEPLTHHARVGDEWRAAAVTSQAATGMHM